MEDTYVSCVPFACTWRHVVVRTSASTGGVGLTTCSRAQAPTTLRGSLPVRRCRKADLNPNIPCSPTRYHKVQTWGADVHWG